MHKERRLIIQIVQEEISIPRPWPFRRNRNESIRQWLREVAIIIKVQLFFCPETQALAI